MVRGYSQVTGRIKAPANNAFQFAVVLQSDSIFAWNGTVQINDAPPVNVVALGNRATIVWSPAIITSSQGGAGYSVKVANGNLGQTWTVSVTVMSPYPGTKLKG